MPHAAMLASMGLITSVLAPLVVLLTADSRLWRRVSAPAPVLLGVFLVLHTAITVGTIATVPMPAMVAARAALLAGAVLFWLPVLGPDHCRLRAGQCSLYLYLAAPVLDLSAVFIIGFGDETGGLAMIVAMLPIGFTGMALTWRWVTSEERAAQEAERADLAARTGGSASLPRLAGTTSTSRPGLAGAAERADLARRDGAALPPAAPSPSLAAGRRGLTATRPALGIARRGFTATRRGLSIALSLSWLSAAILQAQPAMFTARLSRQVLLPAAAGQPAPLGDLIRFCAHLEAAHPAPANACFVAVQALLAAGIAWPRTTRPALAASIGWAAAVWVAGEGLGGLATGMGGVLTGGPGAAALYALLAAAAMPEPGGCGRGVPPPRWLPAAWAGLWLCLLVAGPWPGATTGANLRGQLTGSAVDMPAAWAHQVRVLAAAAGRHPLSVVAALAAGEAVVALAALRPGGPRALASALGATLALAAWACGAGAGDVASGLATDVGTGPPLVLLAVAVASTGRAARTCRGPEPDARFRAPRENRFWAPREKSLVKSGPAGAAAQQRQASPL